MNERERLLRKIAAVDFAIVDLHLFLDSHPNNETATQKVAEYEAKSKTLRAEFEEKFGPLMSSNLDANRWAWISNPWPWDVQTEKEGV
jgi:spore coat protein JB